MANKIFAACSNDKAYVFTRNFHENKWENFHGNTKSCKVQFLKRSDVYYFKIVLEDGSGRVSARPTINLGDEISPFAGVIVYIILATYLMVGGKTVTVY